MINDEEAKLLTKEDNLIKCAKKMMNWGANYVVIKKGEHGALLFHEDVIFPSVGFSLESVVDPTGAGLGMTSTVIVGNSSTYNFKDLMINPRGYKSKYNLEEPEIKN